MNLFSCCMTRYLLIFKLVFLTFLTYGQDVFSEQESRRYAHYLIDQGKYDKALDEFERIFFLGGLAVNDIQSAMHSSLCADSYEDGLTFYELTRSEASFNPMLHSTFLDLLLYDRQLSKFIENFNDMNHPEDPARNLHYHVLTNNWNAYDAALQDYHFNAVSLDPFYDRLSAEHDQLRFKSTFLAASFSTLIPGTGKIYTGEWKDGIFSMLAIGIISWQTYRIFKKDGQGSIISWAGVGLGGVFYLSNIYGSARSAITVNQKKYQQLHEKVDRHRLPCPSL